MAYLEKHLRVKRSSLSDAGKGLFVGVDVAPKTIICEYKGRLAPWKDLEHDEENNYLFQINSRWGVDAEKAMKTFGRYANDARGIRRRPGGPRNNAEYIVRGRKVYIAATRKIHAGGEVFVDYGRGYWRAVVTQMKKAAKLA